ncbi:UNVERIFIED_CONTAM: Organic cation/carnitine transporter 7 [Sesamum radiatum]|uniref:Organic cation/carnitine transporter 7 n=1 Tax=Sesamum radiatum TaxID=300843 RepID=A0AAW2R336_SESRA
MGDHESDGYTVDEALSSVGFGAFQGLALVFAGIGFFSGAMEITLLSFIGPALESEWSLSPTEESLLSTAVFGGMSVGSYFLGFIADAYGRRMGNRGVAMITFAVGLLSAFSPDYKSLIVLRFLVGFGAAGGHVYSAWFLEFIPTSNRGAWMSVMSFSWIIGELLEASLAWIIMPRWGWRVLLALTSVPSLAVLLLSNFAPETPRTSSSAFGYASRGTVRPEVLRANPDYASSCLHPTVAFASERNRDYSFISQQPHVPLCRVHHFRPLRKRGLSNFCEGRRLRASERDRENWRNDMPSGGSGAVLFYPFETKGRGLKDVVSNTR